MLQFPCLGMGNFAACSTEHIWESWQRGGGGGKEEQPPMEEPLGGDGLTAQENKLFPLS